MTPRRWCVAAAIFAAGALAASTAIAGAKCGGSGGTRTQTFTCGTGELLNSVTVKAGRFANNIALRCAKIGSGSATDGRTSGGFLGGPDPGYSRDNRTGRATCQIGEFVWSLETQSDWYVDQVTEIRCGPISRFGKVVHGNSDQSINAGGSGGIRCSLQCPDDQAIYKVRVKSGDWIDSIEVFCRRP